LKQGIIKKKNLGCPLSILLKTGLALQAAAKQLSKNEEKIDTELLGAQGQPVDTSGYYFFDAAKALEKMRPSLTLNRVIDGIKYREAGITLRVDGAEYSENGRAVGIVSLGDLAARMNKNSVLGRVRAAGRNEQEPMLLLHIALKTQIFPAPGRNAELGIEAGRPSEQRRRLN
jgi:Monomeric isocitrate dehydrogenase